MTMSVRAPITMYRIRAPLTMLVGSVGGVCDGVGVLKVIVLFGGNVTFMDEFSLSPMEDIVVVCSVSFKGLRSTA